MITRFIPVTAGDIPTGDFEVDLWNDMVTALGCLPDADTEEVCDQKVKEAMADGRLSAKWADASMIKITIEKIR